MKKAWITGARGFLGRRVALHFSENGWLVEGIGRGLSLPGEDEQWGIRRWLESDLAQGFRAPLGDPPDAIVHCAGSASVSTSLVAPQRDFLDNVVSLSHVLEYQRLHCPQSKLVLISSAAVYGQSEGQPLLESRPLAPVSPYGTHKAMAEALCSSYGRFFSVPSVIVRLFSVYGTGLRKQLLWDACQKFARKEPSFHGTGEEARDWLHVDDAARLIYSLVDKATLEAPVFNGGTGIATCVKNIVGELARSFGEMPRFTGKATPGQPTSYVADMTRLHGLGFRPQRNLHDELALYAEWFRMEWEERKTA